MLAERLGVGLEEAESLKIENYADERVASVMSEFNQLLVEELTRTIDFCLTQTADTALDSVYVCGGASKTHGLLEVLATKLAVPVRPLNPIQNLAGSGRKMHSQIIHEMAYLSAVGIGLALRTGGAK